MRPNILIALLTVGIAVSAVAAPAPVTSSSEILTQRQWLYFSSLGFKVETTGTSWQKTSDSPILRWSPSEDSNKPPAEFSIIHRTLKESATLKSIITSSKGDFSRLGLKVDKAYPTKINGHLAYFFDLFNGSNQRMIRQLIMVDKKSLYTLTCQSHQDDFGKIATDCNRMFNHFQLIEP